MAYATINDLLQVEPNITDYGVLDWDVELARSEREINRVLSVRWWPTFKTFGRDNNATWISGGPLLDATRLDPTQWTQACVYHALAYHICPKLTQFSPETDKFQVMMNYYQGRFDHEMDLSIREGVRYDNNDDNTFQDTEKAPDTNLRLKR
jgi:hypothetical protein